jgi:integrase
METVNETDAATPRRRPWNKGKLIGPKPPLQPKHVWAIRMRLQFAGRTRDLALFNLAIDSKLRGCDLVSLRVEDVAPHGYAIDRATVRQRKTGLPVRFEITEQTRQAIDEHLGATRKRAGDFLFHGRCGKDRCLSTRQYARLPAEWIASIGVAPPCSAPIRCGESRRR